MNFIVIMCDTMRPDHLGSYGNDWIKTPNLDAFARDATLFERAYCASWPTIPNRTDLFTGRFGEPLHPWNPLSREALTLPQMMRDSGYVSQLILDTPHMINNGFGFDRPFHSWWMIRGNEVDRFNSDHLPLHIPHPRNRLLPNLEARQAQYLRNTIGRKTEKDYFAPQVFSAAIDWLDRNYLHDKFFLWVDSFDPHEPWDPPKHYVDLYDPGFKGEAPTNFFNDANITPRELKHICACYAGEVTMVDRWIGLLLQKLEQLQIADDTVVFITSDHGTGLGDHGRLSKRAPIYEEVARIVWLMRIPGLAGGKRIKALVQPPDLMPTFLDLAGLQIPDFVQGRSLLPLIKGKKRSLRTLAVTGSAGAHRTAGLTLTTRKWALIHPPCRELWQLYDLQNDPRQKNNVVAKHKQVAEDLHKKLVRWLAQHQAPEEMLHLFDECPLEPSPPPAPWLGPKSKQLLNMAKLFCRNLSFSDD